jgi:pimeloyl-ACP methyl ester carboxylesterase
MDSVTSSDGATITYERSGSGPPLVLVHGGLGNGLASWFGVKPIFQRSFTVYAIDRRGRRETPETEGRSVELECEDVAAVVLAIGEPVFLVGHSYGAVCAAGAAALVPHSVRKLVLYEPPKGDVLDAEFEALEEKAAQGDWEGLVYSFLQDILHVPQQELDMLSNSPLFTPLVEDGSATFGDMLALRQYDFEAERYAPLTMPVQFLVGAESPRPEMYSTDALQAVLPDATVTELPGQAHGALVLDPTPTAEKITHFLLG